MTKYLNSNLQTHKMNHIDSSQKINEKLGAIIKEKTNMRVNLKEPGINIQIEIFIRFCLSLTSLFTIASE